MYFSKAYTAFAALALACFPADVTGYAFSPPSSSLARSFTSLSAEAGTTNVKRNRNFDKLTGG